MAPTVKNHSTKNCNFVTNYNSDKDDTKYKEKCDGSLELCADTSCSG